VRSFLTAHQHNKAIQLCRWRGFQNIVLWPVK